MRSEEEKKKLIEGIRNQQSIIKLEIVIVVVGIVITIAIAIIQSTYKTEYTESGYLVKKTSENCFHYIIDDSENASPEFFDNYYFTIFVDDTYIKFQVPYKVFEDYKLGDHVTVCRNNHNLSTYYSDYNGVIYDIKIPAVVTEF